jgi:hypothetical protein
LFAPLPALTCNYAATPEGYNACIGAMARHGDLYRWNYNIVKVRTFRGLDLLVYTGMAVAGL